MRLLRLRLLPPPPQEDQSLLRALRMALRGLTLALLNDRRWRQFAAPPDPQQDPEYWQLVGTGVGAGARGVERGTCIHGGCSHRKGLDKR